MSSAENMLMDMMMRRQMTAGKTTQAANVMRDLDPRDTMGYSGKRYVERDIKVMGGTKIEHDGNGDLWIFPDNSGLFVMANDNDVLVTYAGDDVLHMALKMKLSYVADEQGEE